MRITTLLIAACIALIDCGDDDSDALGIDREKKLPEITDEEAVTLCERYADPVMPEGDTFLEFGCHLGFHLMSADGFRERREPVIPFEYSGCKDFTSQCLQEMKKGLEMQKDDVSEDDPSEEESCDQRIQDGVADDCPATVGEYVSCVEALEARLAAYYEQVSCKAVPDPVTAENIDAVLKPPEDGFPPSCELLFSPECGQSGEDSAQLRETDAFFGLWMLVALNQFGDVFVDAE